MLEEPPLVIGVVVPLAWLRSPLPLKSELISSVVMVSRYFRVVLRFENVRTGAPDPLAVKVHGIFPTEMKFELGWNSQEPEAPVVGLDAVVYKKLLTELS